MPSLRESGNMPVGIPARLESAMYLNHFGFQDHPFAITPDPAYLYLSQSHREAFGHLLYGTGEHGGFVQLTGEVGTGKTTLLRALVAQEIEDLDVALCLNPRLTVNEFLATVCDDLGVRYPAGATLKTLIDRLNAHLLETHAAGRRTVLIIDEAQNLSWDVLEQIRLLTNLETHRHKLLRIILVGQPELETLLRRPDMRQLAQRITARFHLPPLTPQQTIRYVHYRLQVAGGASTLFSKPALLALHRHTGGIPRLINTVCERALMGAYSRGARRVTLPLLRRAARESLSGHGWKYGLVGRVPRGVALMTALIVAAALGVGLRYIPTGGELVFLEWSNNGDSNVRPDTPSRGMSVAQASQESPREVPQGSDTAAVGTPARESARSARASTGTSPGQGASGKPVRESANAVPIVDSLPPDNAGMSQLLRLWGVFGAEVGSECRELAIGKLRCLKERGSFQDLERFNRPALLMLNADGRRRYVLLTELSATHAALLTPSGMRRVTRERLADWWTGEFRVVWRLQTNTRSLGPGSVGPAVSWLRRRLARAEGINMDTKAGKPSPVFDEALQDQLKRFQLTNGLQPDGLVGSRTMILLNNLAPAENTPFLRERLETEGT